MLKQLWDLISSWIPFLLGGGALGILVVLGVYFWLVRPAWRSAKEWTSFGPKIVPIFATAVVMFILFTCVGSVLLPLGLPFFAKFTWQNYKTGIQEATTIDTSAPDGDAGFFETLFGTNGSSTDTTPNLGPYVVDHESGYATIRNAVQGEIIGQLPNGSLVEIDRWEAVPCAGDEMPCFRGHFLSSAEFPNGGWLYASTVRALAP